MSAYVVDDRTINKILSYLDFAEKDCDRRWILRPLTQSGRYIQDGQEREAFYASLGQEMFDLNVAAVEARYGEGEADKFRPLNYKYKFSLPETAPRIVKALQCLIYQCSEGEIPETELYKVLNEVMKNIALYIVTNSPEYEKAPWNLCWK